ncbi:MAG: elongation factor P [Clostridiales bacterium]|nr:elongation factor P [Clostridiales bacterium]
MVDVNNIKNGMTLLIEGNIYQVVEFLHVKPGKGSAFMKTKLKNLRTGSNLERTFNTNVKFEEARIDRKAVTYLYEAGDTFYFMDVVTYDQFELSAEQIGDNKNYLLENMEVSLTFYGAELLGITLPEKMEYTVVEAEPGIKDSTASAATKNAKIETGLAVRVPMFINEGDRIVITTYDGKYYGRA